MEDINKIKQSTRMTHRTSPKIDLWHVFGSIVLYTIILAFTWAFVVVYMIVL